MPEIKLKSSDGEIFTVNVDIAKCFAVIRNQLLTYVGDDIEDEVVKIDHASSDILKKVIEWATYHSNIPEGEQDEEEKEKILAWEKEFLNVDKKTTFELMMAANFLGISSLIDVTCKKLAAAMHGNAENVSDFLNMY
ncbi:S-phase kinase-associated protein 1-like [Coccinella septempunctata]|uniref:S-phase kinase-associated protein 1-like n=1 Tax=Coccinella septempunctata TaxID=41139 RepID=UPI001D08431D|nr:S-phase kinase-associated protein 1-like [Coccinella septempunctata]XP_044745498.1 S-phase kinase-associated protein 1-like [Coccinella septempunctata]